MKITKFQLKQIIKEEIDNLTEEQQLAAGEEREALFQSLSGPSMEHIMDIDAQWEKYLDLGGLAMDVINNSDFTAEELVSTLQDLFKRVKFASGGSVPGTPRPAREWWHPSQTAEE